MGWINEVSGRVDGPVVQVGVLVGDVRVDAARSIRSAYLAQVQALAPNSIEGRNDELNALAAFCSSESTAENYLWWQAEAWSGKSALLSWFVLHPPAGVHVVSFFITSRLPGQNDRRGFVDNVLDQLHDLAQRPPRIDLTDATREPYLRRLLVDVARQVRDQGEHLVLVVDGLDEDRGVDGSPDAHSIAALLPHHGVRVIVAGRPDPTLPDDVSMDHPLRISARVEQLSPSPEASAVRDVMIRDLKLLLHGSQVQQDLLGFVTAAGGGLSVRDLAELTGASPWQVEDHLRTTAGRSFTRRPGDPPIYLLAHEQLTTLASEMLGPRLHAYHEQLDAWAITYRARGWPPDTPRYLLQGYTAMLAATGDRQRLLDHVIDPRRHEAAYTVFGHHQISISEIEIAQATFLDDDESDLVVLARLAVHRTNLQRSGGWVPVLLPQFWAMLGRVEHAQALLPLIVDPVARTRALMGTSLELHFAGHPDQAARMLDTAEQLTSTFNQYWGTWLHRELVDAAVRIGDHERARRVIDGIQSAVGKADACASAARASLASFDRERAVQWHLEAEETFESRPPRDKLFGRIDTKEDASVFARMAAAAAALGHQRKAAKLVATAIDPKSTYELRSRGDVGEIVRILVRGGFVDAALTVAEARTEIEDREDALLCIVQAMSNNGDLDEAEALARTAESAQHRCARLAAVAVAAGRDGEPVRADRLRVDAEAILEGFGADDSRRFAVVATAVAAADTGHYDRAEERVSAHLLPGGDFDGVLSVAAAFLRRGESKRAERLIEATEQAARSIPSDTDEHKMLKWVDVMIDFGDVDRAEPIVRSLQNVEIRAAAWQRLTEAIAATGDVRRFEAALNQIMRPSRQRRPRMEMIRVLLARGDKREAVRLARAASSTVQCATALDFIARFTYDKKMLDEVIDLADYVAHPEERAVILRSALRTAADMGDRTLAGHLLKRVHAIQDELSEKVRQVGGYTRNVVLPKRIKTLTELAEKVDSRHDIEAMDREAPAVRFGAPPLWAGSSPPSFRTQLARALAIGSWIDVVDRIVEEDSSVYAAIVSELERLQPDSI
ncbi:hypothetical protein ACQPYE_26345 [Actinosynnema sp. CA-299493]